MRVESPILVTGSSGLAGSALVGELHSRGFSNLETPTSSELDLRIRSRVQEYFEETRPDVVFHAAARVGGIQANMDHAAEYMRDNLLMQTNVIAAAADGGVQSLVFFASSAVYPDEAPQPIHEDALCSGPPSPAVEFYATAKLAGIKLCQAYSGRSQLKAISLIPTNLYGPRDNFHPVNSHVLPALIRRFHEAKAEGAEKVTVWGSPTVRREFLHAADLANAAIIVASMQDAPDMVNVGVGEDISIGDLAQLVAKTVAFEGRIEFDNTRPTGVRRRLLDISKLSDLGWRPSIALEEGISRTYEWYCDNIERARR